MNDRFTLMILLLFLLGFASLGISQENPDVVNKPSLFDVEEPLTLKLQYSIRALKKHLISF